MNYYYLKYFVSSEKSNTQISEISGDHNFNDDSGIYAFAKIDFPNISEIKYLLLDKGAELADIMNAVMLVPSGLLINEKVKEILSNFNLPNHKYYSALVKDFHGKVYPYNWLQTSKERDMRSYIDFKLSSFKIRKDMIGLISESVQINSEEELNKIQDNLEFGLAVNLSSLVFKKDFSRLNIDLFKVRRLGRDWIISERLKKSLEDAKVTGVRIEPAINISVAD